MAIATTALSFAAATVAASGTSVVPSLAIPENCHTVLVTNPSTTVTGLVGIATAPAPLTAGTNAQPIAPGATLTLAIGTSAVRGFMLAAGAALVYDGSAAVVLPITYLNKLGQT